MKGSIQTLQQRAKSVGRRVAHTVLTRAVDRIVREAKAHAPVDTGQYQRGLSFVVRAVGARSKAKVTDLSGYGPQIESNGHRPWTEDIVDPSVEFIVEDGPLAIAQLILSEMRVTSGQ